MPEPTTTPTAEGRWQALVEQTPAVVYLDAIDENGTTVYVSPQIERLLGFPVATWKAKPGLWYESLHPLDQERTFDEYLWQRDHSERWTLEYRMIASDGRTVWIREDAQVIRDDQGAPQLVQGVMLDVTRQKEDEERLRHLDRAKDALLHAVSHDLKGPLAAVLGAAMLMADQDRDLTDADRAQLLEGLVNSARRMDRIASNLLDVDRLERGLVQADRKPVDLSDVVRRVLRELEMPAGRKVELELEPVVVSIDEGLVDRIVENLVLNAFKHTAKQTSIVVADEPVRGGAEIRVEDDGQGVPPELREVIFEPYRRASSPHIAGAGIGLSLVAMFAELHGGRAWVTDRTDGRSGASFHVFLPSFEEAS